MTFSPAPAPSAAADDATLVARYISGDDAAFTVLLHRHQRPVYTILKRIVGDSDLAADLTQDVFIKIIDKLRSGTYQENGLFKSWLLRVAHNTAIDVIRRQKEVAYTLDMVPTLDKTSTSRGTGASLPDRDLTPDARLERDDMHAHLRRLIEDLPIAQRQVLLMRHYGQMTFQDIAEATGVSVNTALGRMRYALHNLRRRMQPAAGASLLLAALLAMPPITKPLTFSVPPAEDYHDQNLYPRDADPVRL